MLVWYWKVRIYNSNGQYAVGQIATERDLHDIDKIQEFYTTMTGHKMLLEGMSEIEFSVPFIHHAFNHVWKANQ